MTQTKGLLLTLLVGAAIGYAATTWAKDAQIARLKVTADSVRVADSVTAAHALAFADSVAKVVVAKDAEEAAAKAQAATAAKSVATFHDALHAAIANNTVALAAFDSLEAAHAAEKQQLQNAIVAADAKVLALTAANDTLRLAIGDLNRSVAFLANRVNALHGGTTPKWLKVSLEVVKIGGAFYAGVQAGKKS